MMNKCSCGNKAVSEFNGKHYCRTHFIEEREKEFLDNTDWNDMGILKWLKYMYPEHYRDEFTNEHIMVYNMLLQLYDPRYVNKQHRLRELIAYRGFAKSKIIFGTISYISLHNGCTMKFKAEDGLIHEVKINEKFIVIFSETGGMAEDFVVNIRDEFSTNPMVKYFYKFTIEDAKEEDTGQWTRKAFKINGLSILGLGAGQQARGKIRGAYRPTFVFYDDIYSENNTLTEDRRDKIKKWFDNASLNSVDDLIGKVFLVGTIVHDDTVLVTCEKSDIWKTLKFYPMPTIKFKKFIKEHLIVDVDNDLCKLPYWDEPNEFTRIEKQIEYFKKFDNDSEWEVTWKERTGLYVLSIKYKEAVEKQGIAGFYQEYFHEISPEELKRFSTTYFQPLNEWEVKQEFGYNWLLTPLYKEPQLMNIEFGVDIAGGTKEGDNTVITVGGMISNGKGFVLEQKIGKFAMRDNLHDNFSILHRTDKVMTDRSYISKIGYIDELFRLAIKYNPRIIKIGQGGGSEGAIINEVRRVFQANEFYVNISPRPQTSREGNKIERIKETLLPKYETMSMYHAKGLDKLEYELEYLGKAKNDDAADSLEVQMFNIVRPARIDYNLFKNPVKSFTPKWGHANINSQNDWLNDWRN